MRFTLSCASAVTLPTVMVSTASAHRTGRHTSPSSGPSSVPKTRASAAKLAAFTPTAMKVVTGVGAPS